MNVGTVTGTLEVQDKFSQPLNLFHNMIQGMAVGGGIAAFNSVLDASRSAVDSVVGAVEKSITAYEEAENAVFRLSAAMQSQGQNTEKNLTAYQEQAEALMKLGTVGDEEIMGIQKRFVMLGQSVEMTQKATEATLNLAHATGQDAGEVSSAFVAAARGRMFALRQYGIVVDENIPKSQSLAEAIRLTSERFAGLGGITTFSDQLKNIKLAQEEAWEAMGKGIVTSGKLWEAMNIVRDLLWKMVDLLNQNKDAVRSLVNDGIMILADAFVYAAKAALIVNEAFSDLKIGWLTFVDTTGDTVTVVQNAWLYIQAAISAVIATLKDVSIGLVALYETATHPFQSKSIFEQMQDDMAEVDTANDEHLTKIQAAIDMNNALSAAVTTRVSQEILDEVRADAIRAKSLEDFVRLAENIRGKLAAAPESHTAVAGAVGTVPKKAETGTNELEAYTKKVNELYNGIDATIQKTAADLRGDPIAAGMAEINKTYSDLLLKIPEFQKEAAKAGQTFDVPRLIQTAGALRDIQTEMLLTSTRQQVLGATFGDTDVEVNKFNTTLAQLKGGLPSLTNESIQNLIAHFQQLRDIAAAAGLPTKALDDILKKLQTDMSARSGNFLRQVCQDAANVATIANAAAGALSDVGLADSNLAKITSDVGGLGSAIGDFAKAKGPVQQIAAGIEIFGKGVKLAGDLWKSMFGNAEWEKVNDLRDAWEKNIGTFEELSKKAAAAGVGNLMPQYLAAKTEKDWTTVSEALDKAFAAQDAKDAFVKAAGGADELAEAAAKAGVPLTKLFDAKSKEDVDAYAESFNNLIDLQGQLASAATAAWSVVIAQPAQRKDALATAFASIKILTPEDAAAQASIAMTAWAETVKQQGLLGAAEAFAPIAEKLKIAIESVGGDATALLGPMLSGIGLAGNEAFASATAGAQAFADTLHAFRASELPLTTQQIGAFGTEAQTAFNQAISGGASTQEAFMAIAPLLAQLQSASSQYGFTLDANTQSLIDQAKAAGVAFPVDPIDKVVEAINRLYVLLGGKLPEAATAAGNALDTLSGKTSGLPGDIALANNQMDIFTGKTQGAAGSLADMNKQLSGMSNSIANIPNVNVSASVWSETPTPEELHQLTGHAQGGVATRATAGIFGEAGPEALIPLDQYGGGGGLLTEQVMNTMLARFERSITRAFVSAAQKGMN